MITNPLRFGVICLLILPVCVFAQTGVNRSTAKPGEIFDGNWWRAADADERSGFLDGAEDCLHWVAHAKWLRDIDDPDKEIEKYYKTHPSDRGSPVLTVWQKVLLTAPPMKPRPPGGELYANPHGYVDGLWWRGAYEAQRRGFLVGYLLCLRTTSSKDTYTQSVDYYLKRMDEYEEAHYQADYESIAALLARFKDPPRRDKTSN